MHTASIRGFIQKEAVRQMHGYELLVPFLIADRERQAKEARLAHLAASERPFDHQTTKVSSSTVSSQPALGRLINRFTSRPRPA